MSQAPPAKRQRTEEPEDKGNLPPVRSTSYWFDDGSVIIQAENTQYRIHRSLLSRHSNVFKDMFSLPQPAMDPSPLSEGCPVVFLSDKATDLEHVLSVIYDSLRAHDMRARMSVEFLGATLRLGKKYDIEYLCEEGLERLRFEFPTTLEKWHACFGKYTLIKPCAAITILGLCDELSIPRCLPVAYFLTATNHSLEYILKSYVDGGGILKRDIAIQCVLGRERLNHAYRAILQSWIRQKLFLPSNGCFSRSACAADKVAIIQWLKPFPNEEDTQNEDNPQNFEDNSPHSLYFLEPWDEKFEGNFRLCKPCLASMKLAYDSACELLWSQLPGFFGLQPWDELKDFDM